MENQNLFKFFLALTMALTSYAPGIAWAADAPAAAAGNCKPLKDCKKKVDAWQAQQSGIAAGADSGEQNINRGGARVSQAGAQTAAAACPAKEECKKAKEAADKDNKCTAQNKKDIESMMARATQGCEGGTAAAAAGAQTQSATESGGGRGSNGSGGGGDNSGMMAAMLGAGVLAAMMMKKNQDNQNNQQAQQMPYTGALQANGSIDCSKPDALVYRDCNAQMENRCRTILDDPLCQQFSSRYCGPTSGANAQIMVQPQAPPGVILGVDPSTLYGAAGEGLGSQYCQGVTGWNFCKTAGREACPSCQQIQRNQSPQCAANPALCMAQNSTAEIDRARGSCPTDPVFANPSVAATGAVTGVPAVISNGGALPAVVLPQSVGAKNQASSGGGSGAAAAGGGISIQSTSSGNPAEQGVREGYGPGTGSQNSFGSGVGVNSAGSVSVGAEGSANHPGGREFASAGGIRPASAVTNEIEGQYGPSLFTSTSQVIRRRCQTGRLNNCP